MALIPQGANMNTQNKTGLFDEPILFAICLSTIFGMACWDLVFETQNPLDPQALAAVYHFYRVLIQGESLILITLR